MKVMIVNISAHVNAKLQTYTKCALLLYRYSSLAPWSVFEFFLSSRAFYYLLDLFLQTLALK